MGGPSADEPPDKVKSAARSTSSKRDDVGRAGTKRSLLPFFRPSHGHDNAASHQVDDATVSSRPAAAPPPRDTKPESEKPPSVGASDGAATAADKTPIPTRIKNGSLRFVMHTKNTLLSSWINVLLVFVPIGIAVNFADLSPSIVFAMNAVAIVPLAGLLSKATESVADRLGDTWGALLNVSFGNAVELIIFIIALAKNEIGIVQASILGSILSNLLLILGMAFFLGGLRYQEQIYNSTVTQMSACMLSLSVMSLLLPTAFHASWSDSGSATLATLQVSRGTSVILLIIYGLYLLFQLKSHAFLYESLPQQMIDEESRPGVLHNVLDSSSSSSSSDTSSDDDSDSSSASGGTAKRAFRRLRRMRRKSNASSKETHHSTPSAISSPSHERETFHPGTSRRTSTLQPVQSRDEGEDADVEGGRAGDSTTVRDFEQPASSYKKGKKKHRKKRHHRKSRAESKGQSDMVEMEPIPGLARSQDRSSSPDLERKVGFASPTEEESQQAEDEKKLAASRNRVKNPFNMPTRPAIRKTLSTAIPTVFQTPTSPSPGAPQPLPGKPSPPIRVPMGPRRVKSLPDQMNARAMLFATNSNANPTPVPPPVMNPYLEREVDDEHPTVMSRTAAVVILLISTGLVALCAECMVDAIPAMTANSAVSQTFIGLIILPIVGNAAEHVTAVTVAIKNKMDLAIGVAVGSSIQIALFVTPLIVLLGWIMDKDMSLYFNLFQTVSLFVTAFVVNFLVLDGRSNYLEGALLMGAYIIIAVAAFFYPDDDEQSELGGYGAGEVRRLATRMIATAWTG